MTKSRLLAAERSSPSSPAIPLIIAGDALRFPLRLCAFAGECFPAETQSRKERMKDSISMSDLIHRPRRLRKTDALRSLVRETRLHPEDFILPLFACAGEGIRREIGSMPGVQNLSVDQIVHEVVAAYALGVRGVILFGLPATKDEMATGAYDEKGIVQQAVRAVKREVPDLIVIADTCLCEYTSHGHCGVVRDGEVLNDKSLELLAGTAVSQAQAGADIVAPSAMMDGQVNAIRDG